MRRVVLHHHSVFVLLLLLLLATAVVAVTGCIYLVAVTVMVESFILKVGRRLIWNDPNRTCETTGVKLMILSST